MSTVSGPRGPTALAPSLCEATRAGAVTRLGEVTGLGERTDAWTGKTRAWQERAVQRLSRRIDSRQAPMRLTAARSSFSSHIAERERWTRIAALVSLAGVTACVFALDRTTGLPHVQHLYYFPIIFAAIRFGTTTGV